uniref:DUF2958 domain-containing protein n=1 Tax=uncultured Sphingomonas sp. TaxID=158754 RepID=UPI0035CB8080
MHLLTAPLRARLLANGGAAARRTPRHDPVPVVKLFNPLGPATWLATELDTDGDTLFGLADLGFGCPELGCFSLHEIAALRLPFGLRIERDLSFTTGAPLSGWINAARPTGSISAAETLLARAGEGLRSHPLPRSDPDRG